MARHRVLSTKKLEPWLIEKAKGFEIDVQEQEAIRIEPILTKEKQEEVFELLGKRIAHAVFTSSNAVTSLKKILASNVHRRPASWKMFCLSGKTKQELEKNTELFGNIEGTATHSKDLAEVIVKGGIKELIFFCGNKRREELAEILSKAGVKVHEVVLYETVETPSVANNDFDAVLFFSPSAVQSFFSVNQLKQATVCFAIGDTTANSIKAFTENKIIISKDPAQEEMLKQVHKYFTNKMSDHH